MSSFDPCINATEKWAYLLESSLLKMLRRSSSRFLIRARAVHDNLHVTGISLQGRIDIRWIRYFKAQEIRTAWFPLRARPRRNPRLRASASSRRSTYNYCRSPSRRARQGHGCLHRRLSACARWPRRCDDFAVPFAGEHADECSQLLLEWGAPRVHGHTPGT